MIIQKLKMIVMAAVAALSAVLALFVYRRRRRPPCYLHDDPKPQHCFKRVLVDNSYPPLKSNDTDKNLNLHPYNKEITELMESPRHDQLKFVTEKLDLKASYIWVESESQLKELAEVLREQKAFGVDTEQHSLRSFLGFTALLQISTESEDYLVDTIALHDCMSLLRPVFADAGICKVFHGADSDVLWLQRDFQIYVVNMFDTVKACEVLSKPHKSLASLLDTYCGVVSNKLLRLEDWRQRPLSMEMVQYARTDAHYLLYIAGRLISELEDKGNSCPDDKSRLVLEASRHSNMLCLQLYSKDNMEASPVESAAASILRRYFNGRDHKFVNAVRRLCAWRDLMARVHDESLRYVISDQAIAALTEKTSMTAADMLSTIAQADCNVDSSSNPSLSSPSPVVCSHLNDLHYLLHDKTSNPDDLVTMILQNCLGTKGSCPLSLFNYALRVKCDLKMALNPKQNGVELSKHNDQMGRNRLRKSPVYHNCRLYANDGQLLGYCNHGKIAWYLFRGIATLVEEDPPAIKLSFDHKGRPDNYISSKKNNICVGCGERNYMRYEIIPYCYNMHLQHLRSRPTDNIVLLCVDCHKMAHAAANNYKRRIADEFNIPLLPRASLSTTITEDARKAAMALLRHGSEMPCKRREELTEIVKTCYGGRQISQEDLENALLFRKNQKLSSEHSGGIPLHLLVSVVNGDGNYESSITPNGPLDSATSKRRKKPKWYRCKNKNRSALRGHGPHGKEVVDHLLKEHGKDGVSQFCQRWRKVFVESVHPRFLPAGWDINTQLLRDLGEVSVFNPTRRAPATT